MEKIEQFYVENGLMKMEQFQFTYLDKFPTTEATLPFDNQSIMLYPIEPDMLADADVEWRERTYPPDVPV